MHFILDGYNIIRTSDWLMGGSVADQRLRLIQFVERQRPQGRNAVTVVFDGGAREPERGGAGVAVIFSLEKSADDVIKEKVDNAGNARDITVVTNDRAIQKWVRGAGAQIMACGEFLGRAKSPRPHKSAGGLPPGADDINEELKDLWKLK